MTCLECGQEFKGKVCPCGWKPSQPDKDARTAKRGKTTFILCAWDKACNIPVRSQGKDRLNQRTLCYFHDAHVTAPDQTHNFDAFQSWILNLNKNYPNLGWWKLPQPFIWQILHGLEQIP